MDWCPPFCVIIDPTIDDFRHSLRRSCHWCRLSVKKPIPKARNWSVIWIPITYWMRLRLKFIINDSIRQKIQYLRTNISHRKFRDNNSHFVHSFCHKIITFLFRTQRSFIVFYLHPIQRIEFNLNWSKWLLLMNDKSNKTINKCWQRRCYPWYGVIGVHYSPVISFHCIDYSLSLPIVTAVAVKRS